MPVPILAQAPYLIASVQTALTDADLIGLQNDLFAAAQKRRCHGIVVDVTALDVIDSFSTRTLQNLAAMLRLRGVEKSSPGSSPLWRWPWWNWACTCRTSAPRWTLTRASPTCVQGRTGQWTMDSDTRVQIDDESDILKARQTARAMAADLGFDLTSQTLIATAISELARNILKYARSGEILLRPAARNGVLGITVIAADKGPRDHRYGAGDDRRILDGPGTRAGPAGNKTPDG